MNVEHIEATIRSIEQGGYEQDRMYFEDGRPACIPTHAASLAGLGFEEDWEYSGICDRAREFLGLNEEQGKALFAVDPMCWLGRPVTKQEAVATLRLLQKTGKVEWKEKGVRGAKEWEADREAERLREIAEEEGLWE